MQLKSIAENHTIQSGPGIACAVIEDGKIIAKEVVGLANVDTEIPITEETAFRLASVSKQFVAASILMLVQDKELTLDDPMREFFPEFPDYGKDITLRHLLTHASGLKDYEELLPPDYVGPILDDEVLGLMLSQSEGYFKPGEQYRYSNTGFCLLHLVIERVSGQSIELFLTERIFVPLGMHTAFVHMAGMPDTDIAYGYSPIPGGYKLHNHDVTSWTIGDGGVYASIDDLIAWSSVYFSRRIGEYDLTEMFEPHVPTDEPGRSYGYGLVVLDAPRGRVIYHEGETVGSRICIYYLEQRRLFVAVELNRDDADPFAICAEVVEAFSSIPIRL